MPRSARDAFDSEVPHTWAPYLRELADKVFRTCTPATNGMDAGDVSNLKDLAKFCDEHAKMIDVLVHG